MKFILEFFYIIYCYMKFRVAQGCHFRGWILALGIEGHVLGLPLSNVHLGDATCVVEGGDLTTDHWDWIVTFETVIGMKFLEHS